MLPVSRNRETGWGAARAGRGLTLLPALSLFGGFGVALPTKRRYRGRIRAELRELRAVLVRLTDNNAKYFLRSGGTNLFDLPLLSAMGDMLPLIDEALAARVPR